MDSELDSHLEYLLEGSASSTCESPSPNVQLTFDVAQESGAGHHDLVSPFSIAQYLDPSGEREASHQTGNALFRYGDPNLYLPDASRHLKVELWSLVLCIVWMYRAPDVLCSARIRSSN
jgi:hypothetical protein